MKNAMRDVLQIAIILTAALAILFWVVAQLAILNEMTSDTSGVTL